MENVSLRWLPLLLLIVTALASLQAAAAGQRIAFDQCRLYGYAPHTRAYALCRMNVRRYWTTGPCEDADFAFAHREYCHLNPPPFL
jgi:hypothetical protein